ncbi:calcium-binding protein [Myxococcus faecalis]|uniref:calcium-binding protein n=1 Tax=Myxococcus TaxID=32 RepID=UPI001CBEC3C2|nr:calcium-binding protein [Myxococcus sp. XM-1-1-1]
MALVWGAVAPGSAQAALQLPGLDLTAHCVQRYGSGAFATLTANNAYGWSCYKNGQYLGMDLNQACQTQHTNGFQAAYRNFNDAYSWYCQLRANYTSQQGLTHSLYVWKGQYVALRTPDITTCASSTKEITAQMALLVDGFDRGYTFYKDVTGAQPSLFRNYYGLNSMAVLPSGYATGCGSSTDPACGERGRTGIEFRYNLYQTDICAEALATVATLNNTGFYELGRNFWFYENQLASTNGNYAHAMVTGYAVLMRFLSMDYYALPVSTGHASLYNNVKSLVNTYRIATAPCTTPGVSGTRVSPGSTTCYQHDWANTLLVKQGVGGLDTTDLFASFVLRLKHVHGWPFIFQLWRKVGAISGTATSPYTSADNFVLAASRAANVNLADVFETAWRWPVSMSVRNTLQSELGNPVSTTPYL